MDLRFTPEELAFRDEVRAFFRANLPEGIRSKLVEGRHLAKDDIVIWQRTLNAKGWAVANWPVAWGGTGWTPLQQYIFQEELQQTPAPQPLGFGVTMVGPVIIAFGSKTQKKRFLPAIDRDDRANRDPRRLHVDQQKGNPLLLFGLRIRAHEAEDPIGVLREGSPGLLSVDDVVAVFTLSRSP